MKLKEFIKLNKTASFVYAMGIWTMVGSYAYLKYTGRLNENVVQTETEVAKPDDMAETVFSSPHARMVVTYKKDFVPYTTRIYNYIKSLSGDDDK